MVLKSSKHIDGLEQDGGVSIVIGVTAVLH